MVFEWDDFGANHVISDQCQSHDCRDKLDELHKLNPAFKATLFAIPAEMTIELIRWSVENMEWIELGVHGFSHSSNYECEGWTYQQMAAAMQVTGQIGAFKRLFRAPGWQISDGCLKWLQEKGWIVADQGYNDERRPGYMNAYVHYENEGFKVLPKKGDPRPVEAYHGHTWDVGWNGIYEDFEKVKGLVKSTKEFKFVTELFL